MSQAFSNLYLIGLTGNIGCGKSTVSAMLREHGAAVSDSDQVTRRVMEPGQPAYAAIVRTWGETILSAPGGPIDRPALGRIVFGDPDALRQLERIVHPATREANLAWLAEQNAAARAAGERRLAVVDAVKLIEAGYPPLCDAVWVVVCDEREQLRRLVEVRGMSVDDARQRVAAQPPQAEKAAVADVVIDNSGTLDATRAQVEQALNAVKPLLEAS